MSGVAGEQLLGMWHAGRAWTFTRAERQGCACFGGPLEAELRGPRFGPRGLHQLAAIDLRTLPHMPDVGMASLDLVYGMTFDGCRLRYRCSESGGRIDILALSPRRSSRDWPYRHYPELLPFCWLQTSSRRCSYQSFAAAFANLPEEAAAELVCVVPAPATLGMSLWGPVGDQNGVAIVFECEPKTREVSAYNVCD